VGEQLESRALLTAFHVTTTAAYGPGSLRVAIAKANESPGPDAVVFQLPGDGVHDLSVPNEGLPPVAGRLVIDGYTQPGSARNTSTDPAVNNARITVNLVRYGGQGGVLTVNPRGSGTQIRGLGFYSSAAFGVSGVVINRANLVTVDGNVFGARGQSRLSAAVRIVDGDHNTIGGDEAGTPALQNVMGTYDTGVELSGTARQNAIYGNFIGREPSPSRNPLQAVGVWLRPGADNNAVVRNILFKNIDPVANESTGNWIADNIVVPR
jgi:hypothetical protein